MIRASTSFATVAGVVSLALHLSGIAVMWRADPVQIQGGAPSAVTQLGNSFRNLAEGVQNPVETTEVRETEYVASLTSPVQQDTPLESTEPERVLTSAPPVQQTATLTPAPPAMTAPVVANDALEAVTAIQTSQAITLEQVSAQPVTPLASVQQNALEALPNHETNTAVQVSRRPQLRSRVVEAAQAEKPPAPRTASKPQPKQGQQQPQETAGSADGQENATQAQTSNANRPPTQVGNAAASNYPGRVVRKIQRVRRPRMRGLRGTAHLAFSIAPSGALASLRISHSSGNAQLDAAALQILRAAAPFPKPPQGARTAFTYRISY